MAKKATVAESAPKPNLFAKAKATVKPAPKKPKKGTTYLLPIENGVDPADPESHRKMTPVSKRLHDAISIMLEQDQVRKTAEGKVNTAKGIVMPVAMELVVEDWAKLGVIPDSPLKIQNDKGEEVSLVIQDKSQQYSVSDEQVEQLRDLFGDAVDEIVEQKTEFVLDSKILEEHADTISNALIEALGEDLAMALLQAKPVQRVAPNTITRLAELCQRSPVKILAALEALGSACVRYLKC